MLFRPVVLFSVDGEKSTLTYIEEQGTGGRHARQFGLQPNLMHMAIPLPDTDQVLASRIEEGNGRLKPSELTSQRQNSPLNRVNLKTVSWAAS